MTQDHPVLLPVTVQEILKSARTRKKATLAAVHQETRISVAFLEALENGRWSVFPAEVYLVGSLKRYSTYLGLNGEEMAAQLNKERNAAPPPQEGSQSGQEHKDDPAESEPESNVLLKFAVLAFLLLTLAGWLLYGLFKASSLVVPGSMVRTVPAPMPAEALKTKFSRSSFVQGESMALEVKAHENVWVRILADDKLNFEGFVQAGTIRSCNANEKIFIRIGNTKAVSLSLNGRALNPQQGAVQSVNEMMLTHQSLLDDALFLPTASAPTPPAPVKEPRAQ